MNVLTFPACVIILNVNENMMGLSVRGRTHLLYMTRHFRRGGEGYENLLL